MTSKEWSTIQVGNILRIIDGAGYNDCRWKSGLLRVREVRESLLICTTLEYIYTTNGNLYAEPGHEWAAVEHNFYELVESKSRLEYILEDLND